MRHSGTLTAFVCSGFIFLFFVFPHLASAATWYANSSTGNDTTGNGSSGSPFKTFTKAYASSTAGDTIDLTGTFDWSNSAETTAAVTGFTITKNLRIQGHGPDQTIIQASSTQNVATRRVFTIGATSTVTFDSVAIRYGYLTGNSDNGGAGLYVQGTTSVTNSEIYSNNANNYYDFGGGIYTLNDFYIASSSVYNNTTAGGGGGGIFVDKVGATTTVINTTLYGNRRTATTGNTDGAAIYNSAGNLVMINDTVTGNTATIGNTGVDMTGYYASSTVIENTIITGNTADNGTYVQFGYRDTSTTSPIVDFGYNFISGTPQYYTLTNSSDWKDTTNTGAFTNIGSSTMTGNIKLDSGLSLNDNSANRTHTVALLQGSIAIDNATTTSYYAPVPTTDQRGATRSGAGPDAGSFEYNGGGLSVTAPTTQTSNITFSGAQYNKINVSYTPGNGDRRVLFMAQAGSGSAPTPTNGTTYTPSTVFGSGASLGSGWYAVYDSLATTTSFTVTGLSASTTYSVEGFEYNGTSNNSPVYLTTTGTNNPASGTTYIPVTWYANSSTGTDTNNGTINSPFRSFTKAYASSTPGDTIDLTGTFDWADAVETAPVGITGFTLSKDLTIQGHDASNTIIEASSTPNAAGTNKRVFTIGTNNTVTMKYLTIQNGNNQVAGTYEGGCLEQSATSSLTLLYVDVNNCKSQGNGAGLYTNNVSSTTILNSSFRNNVVATGYGGGLFEGNYSTSTIVDSTFTGNTNSTSSVYYGGAIYVAPFSATYLVNDTLTKNAAYYGGGITSGGASTTIYLKNTIVAGNTSNTTASTSADLYRPSSTASFVSGGYNIVGRFSNAFGIDLATTTGDWTDLKNSGTFTKYSSTATGTLLLAASSAADPTLGTYTFALQSGSIGVDQGTTTALVGGGLSVAVPTTDERNAARVNAPDIGAYELQSADVTPPVISGLATSTGTSTVSVSFTTNELATSTLQFGTSTSYGTILSVMPATTTHAYSLTALTASTTYHFMIQVTDTSGNTATTTDYIVVTNALPDTTPPLVSIISPSSGAVVTGTTTLSASSSDNVAVAGVTFYVDGVKQGSEVISAPYSISWNSAATSTGAQNVFAVARDTSNNYATSSIVSFTADNNPPVIGSLAASPVTSSGATISFTTAVLATSSLQFGTSTSYGSTVFISPATTTHIYILSSLNASTTYHYQVTATDSYGIATSSSDQTFTTGAAPDTTPPSVSLTAPAPATVVYGIVPLSATASDNVAVAGVSFYVDGSLVGSEDTSSPYSVNWDSTTASSGPHSVFAVARDTSNNYATTSSTNIIVDNAAPVISTISSGTPGTSSAIISWATDEAANSQVEYGTSPTYTASTTLDASLVTNHSETISGLNPSTLYYYRVLSSDARSELSTSTAQTFTTASVLTQTPQSSGAAAPITAVGSGRGGFSSNSMTNLPQADGCPAGFVCTPNTSFVSPAHPIQPSFPEQNQTTWNFTQSLQQGATGSQVKTLQQYLNDHGFTVALFGAGSAGNETSYFGPATKAALKQFQKAKGISPASGYFGPITRAYIASH